MTQGGRSSENQFHDGTGLTPTLGDLGVTKGASSELSRAVRHKNRAYAALCLADVFCARWQTRHGSPELPLAWRERREELAADYQEALAWFYEVLEGRGTREC